MNSLFPHCLACLLACMLFPNPTTGQSTVISLATSPTDSLGSQLVEGETIPVSTTSMMRSMEQILAHPQPSIGPEEMSADTLIRKLNDLGLPVILSETAIDDGLSGDQVLQIGLTGIPLITRLNSGLDRFNAMIQLFDDRAMIISKDFNGDPEFFVTLTYDVSRLVSGGNNNSFYERCRPLATSIMASVHQDSWSQTGTGEQNMTFLLVDGKSLMSISAPWSHQVLVRRYLSSLTGHAGDHASRAVRNSRHTYFSLSTTGGSSSPVQVPAIRSAASTSRREHLQKPGGLKSGGLFSVSDRLAD